MWKGLRMNVKIERDLILSEYKRRRDDCDKRSSVNTRTALLIQ
jgi:hypothetical protein